VYCQLERLRHCLPPSVRGILDELPETLDETYERVLRDINKANRHHTYRLLHCLTVAIRPLRVEELAEVLTIDFDAALQGGIPKSNPDWRWPDQHQAVLSTCSSLITIVDDGDSQVVQFSHFSVKEFLISDRLARSCEDVSRYHIGLRPAHTILAQACLGVLLHFDNTVNGDTARNIPLAEYAARHWVDHAQFEGVSSSLRDAMEYFFDGDKPHWAAWSRVYDMDKHWLLFSPDLVEHGASPLYYASLCGLYDPVEHLIGNNSEDINAQGGRMVVPLVAALHGKHFQVAELLRRHGADVNVRGRKQNTPLNIASVHGRVDIIHWLLTHGAELNPRQVSGWTPLHLAVFHGRLEAARALLEHGADISALNNGGEVPLHLALSLAHDNLLDVLQLLISYGSDVNARNKQGSTLLHYLVRQRGGKITVEGMRLLLKHGANIDARDNEGRSPLQVALEHEHHEIAKFLSEQGATG
jgi:ankyrin repeat protein